MRAAILLLCAALAGCRAPAKLHPDTVAELVRDNQERVLPKLDLDVKTVETKLPPQKPGYLIGVGDVLDVDVPGHPEFGGARLGVDNRPLGQRVKQDGKIYLPLVGGVPAAGRTVLALRDDLNQRLTKYLKEPFVSVEMLAYKSQRFYVLGAVQRPGAFPVDGTTKLLDGLGEAGGVKETGDLEGAYVVRGRSLLPISLADILLRGDTSRNIYMRNGDLVYVPPAVKWQVYVLGEVRKPGVVPLPQTGLSLTAAVAGAGGLDPINANRNEIRVFRGSWQAPKVFTLSTEDLYRCGDAIQMKPGDRVVVAARGLATWSRTMQLLLPFIQPASLAATIGAVATR